MITMTLSEPSSYGPMVPVMCAMLKRGSIMTSEHIDVIIERNAAFLNKILMNDGIHNSIKRYVLSDYWKICYKSREFRYILFEKIISAMPYDAILRMRALYDE